MKSFDAKGYIGFSFVAAAYAIWELFAPYWDHLTQITSVQVTARRVSLTAIVVLGFTVLRGNLGSVYLQSGVAVVLLVVRGAITEIPQIPDVSVC